MKVLTMTRVLSDIDSLAMMEYTDAADRPAYVRKFCRANYGAANPELTAAVNRAFFDAVTGSQVSARTYAKSIGTEALY